MRTVLGPLAALTLALAFPGVAGAAICMVNTTADIEGSTDDPSLRYCVNFLNGRPGTTHTLRFATPPNSVLKLESSLPPIQGRPFKIDGANRSPIIDGQGQYSIFTLENGASVEILKLTLRNGRREDAGGGCVASFAPSNATIMLDEVIVQNCGASFTAPGDACGGAIHGDYAITIKNSRFHGNVVDSSGSGASGGAICAGANLTLNNDFFQDNIADARGSEPPRGGAVYVTGELTVRDSQFMSNSAVNDGEPAGFGGAIHASGAGALLLDRNAFFDNIARAGSAIHVDDGSGAPAQAVIDNNSFVGNVGNGAVLVRAPYVLHNNSFWRNRGLDPGAGAHFIADGPRAELRWFTMNLLAATEAASPACSAEDIPPDDHPDSAFNAIVDPGCGFLVNAADDSNLYPSAAEVAVGSFRRLDGRARSMPVLELLVDSVALDVLPYVEPDDEGNQPCSPLDVLKHSRTPDGGGNPPPGGDCDIGAYEIQHGASIFNDGFDAPLLR